MAEKGIGSAAVGTKKKNQIVLCWFWGGLAAISILMLIFSRGACISSRTGRWDGDAALFFRYWSIGLGVLVLVLVGKCTP